MDREIHPFKKIGKVSELLSWALYDFGNSAFSAVVETFVFAPYFALYLAQDSQLATAEWGFASALAALITAIFTPIPELLTS